MENSLEKIVGRIALVHEISGKQMTTLTKQVLKENTIFIARVSLENYTGLIMLKNIERLDVKSKCSSAGSFDALKITCHFLLHVYICLKNFIKWVRGSLQSDWSISGR